MRRSRCACAHQMQGSPTAASAFVAVSQASLLLLSRYSLVRELGSCQLVVGVRPAREATTGFTARGSIVYA